MFGPCGFCNVRFEFKFHLPNDSTLDFEKKKRKSLKKKEKGEKWSICYILAIAIKSGLGVDLTKKSSPRLTHEN
jgi:hypothetical protein